ncbi:DUF1501 domain-containing protein [Nocardioides sp. URHA0020]|uniref:DUF1501 domain-containing protein n=1 Tax=Nocardioides sp. URHA0020 TaxID=1380392 RepID=UPI00068784D1|nr:DUF1501 domain-containing protein [Nocardioides sp. URHA0020]
MSALPLEPADLADCDCRPASRDLGAPVPTPSRRALLRGAALAGATTMFGSAAVTLGPALGPAAAASVRRRPTPAIVVISLRGAADGLSLVVPHGDPVYYQSRPGIGIAASALVGADGFFGMHPAMAPLLPLWNSGKLAAIHATGLPAPNRSHFAAMEELEDADPGSSRRVGWLNRLVGNDNVSSTLQGLVVGSSVPTSMVGPEPVMSFASLDTANLAGGDRESDPRGRRVQALRTQWTGRTTMSRGFREALDAVVDLDPARAQRDRRRLYPEGDLGDALSSVARTLRANLGVSAVTVDSGDWDMHLGLGHAGGGWMKRNAGNLASSIAAFFADLGSAGERVTLVTISEFGRRVQENANGGLDHGWGNVMLAAGAGVKGGRYYGTWPGLQNGLDADLAVTTDYRSVLAEIVAARTTASPAQVFPGFQREHLGFMTGQ